MANNYYPFGLTFNSYKRVTAKENKYLFNGIERQTDLDLGWDLAEFRSYSPEIGRWHQIDPKASERESPYVGFANNPLLYVDPLGDTTTTYVDEASGEAVYVTEAVIVSASRTEDNESSSSSGSSELDYPVIVNNGISMPFVVLWGPIPNGGVMTTGSNGEVQNSPSNRKPGTTTAIIDLDDMDALFTALGLPNLKKSIPAKNAAGKTGGKDVGGVGMDQLPEDSRNGVVEYIDPEMPGINYKPAPAPYNGDTATGYTPITDSTRQRRLWKYYPSGYRPIRTDTVPRRD